MKLKSIVFSAALVAVGMTTMAFSSASMAGSYDNCTPLVHLYLQFKPTYFYKPNGESYVRVYMETKLVNVSQDKVYFLGERGNLPAYSYLKVVAQGKTPYVKNHEKVTRYFAPRGVFGMRQLGVRPVNVPLAHLNADMKITVEAHVWNSGCAGKFALPKIRKTYDVRPMLTGGKATQVGRTYMNYVDPRRVGQGAPKPRPRS